MMALVLREGLCIRKTIAPCKECNDRNPGCHDQCSKYIEWKKAYYQKRTELKNYNKGIKDVEDYEIIEKQKHIEKRKKMKKGKMRWQQRTK